LVIWSSYNGLNVGFDLYGQAYTTERPTDVPQPLPPMVSALSSSRLSVSWPYLAGYEVAAYELVQDNLTTLNSGTNNFLVASNFAPSSVHAFQLRFRLADGRQSALSSPAMGTTWGEDLNGDGLPDDWQARYWGPKDYKWPAGKIDTDGDGMSNYQEFLVGTDPTDPNSVLRPYRTKITVASEGTRLHWNTQPGFIYQVQSSTDCRQWQNWGAPRFAAEAEDSVLLQIGGETVYYRIICIHKQ
jgi:hypothetical protein